MKTLPGKSIDEQIFAIGDIHGQAGSLEKALKRISEYPRNGKPSHLIFTGDIIDRGPENLRSIELTLNAANLANVDKVTFLPGNHELMMLEAIRDPLSNMNWWGNNGGYSVISEVIEDGVEPTIEYIVSQLKSLLSEFIDLINTSPDNLQIGDLVFVHAGILPGPDIDQYLSIPRHPRRWDEYHWLWIREPFLSHTGGWDDNGDVVVVHGHTGHHKNQKLDPAMAHDFLDLVDSKRRICIDAGSAQFDQVALLVVSDGNYQIEVIQENEFRPGFDACEIPQS